MPGWREHAGSAGVPRASKTIQGTLGLPVSFFAIAEANLLKSRFRYQNWPIWPTGACTRENGKFAQNAIAVPSGSCIKENGKFAQNAIAVPSGSCIRENGKFAQNAIAVPSGSCIRENCKFAQNAIVVVAAHR